MVGMTVGMWVGERAMKRVDVTVYGKVDTKVGQLAYA